MYVPLRVDTAGALNVDEGEVIGAFQIYLPYQPIAAAIASDTRTLYIALVVGLGVLYLGLFQLVSRASRRIRRQASENQHQALHDSLTDLPNRLQFQDRLAEAIRVDTPAGLVSAALVVDLDRFKEINDAVGHASGDRLLCLIGERLVDRLGDEAMIARFGGDEFGVLFRGLPADVHLEALGARVAAVFDTTFEVDGLELDVPASVGVAASPAHGPDAASLVRHADVAMYVAKRARSGVEVYSEDEDLFNAERLELAAEVVVGLLDTHVEDLTGYVDAHVAGDDRESTARREAATSYMEVIADALAGAIAQQNPQRFPS